MKEYYGVLWNKELEGTYEELETFSMHFIFTFM